MKHEDLTASALDELTAEEQAQLEAFLKEDDAARMEAEQTKAFCSFLTQHLQDPSMALEAEQRAKLQHQASQPVLLPAAATADDAAKAEHRPRQVWPQKSAFRNVLAIAATIAVLATTTLLVLRDQEGTTLSADFSQEQAAPPQPPAPSLTLKTQEAMKIVSGKKQDADEVMMEAARTKEVAAPAVAPAAAAPARAVPMVAWNDSSLTGTAAPQPLQVAPLAPTVQPLSSWTTVTPFPSQKDSEYRELDMSASSPVARVQPDMGANDLSGPASPQAASAPPPPPINAPAIMGAGKPASTITLGSGTATAQKSSPEMPRLAGDIGANSPAAPAAIGNSSGTGLTRDGNIDQQRSRMMNQVAENGENKANAGAPQQKSAAPASTRTDLVGMVSGAPGAAATPAPVAASAPVDPAAPMAPPQANEFLSYGDDASRSRPELGDDRGTVRRSEPKPRPTPAAEPEFSNESYTTIVENTLQDVRRAPLSTFSIDVDTAAYANVRRFLNENSAPPRDAVRLEELINYFPTNEEGPAADAKEPFSVRVEMAACPWQPQHRLARIAIKGRELGKDVKPSNLVFLVDVSGSMSEANKLPLVQKSLRMLAENLDENDRVTIVTYAGSSGLALPSTNGTKKAEIIAAIDRLQAGGSTHGSSGIRLAYEQAVSHFIKGGINRVILCTDGDFNVGVSTPEDLENLITEKARSGVFLSVLGYGRGNLKDRTMETLADKGNGNYAYIDSLSEARKVLVEQMAGTLVTIAKDVKIQVEFNPAIVRSYRLIGYENRLLAKEDFNDDTKDAGEIGAGHSVTALYELAPANLPPGATPSPLVDKLKYQQEPGAPAAPGATADAAAKPAESDTKEAMTVKLRYKEPDGATSKLIEVPVNDSARESKDAGSEFKFTAAVAGFGLLLRNSSYAGELSWEQVRQLALQGKGTDELGYRGEFIQLIEKARGLSNR